MAPTEINGQTFDKVILACGAWLGQTLEPLGFEVDVRPKGQLRNYFFEGMDTDRLPVLMPEGDEMSFLLLVERFR